MKWRLNKIVDGLSRNLVMAGTALGIIYWFIEAAVHTYIFKEGSLGFQILSPTIHEIWMRMIVALILVIFSFYGQIIINQRKRAEAAVIQREKETALILENNPAAIILIDVATRKISYANANAQRMVKAPANKILGNACHKFLCPAAKGRCPVLDRGQSIDISERKLLTWEGEVIPVLKSVARVRYCGREHLLEAFFDIREQRRMRQDIRQAHAEMDQIFQTASVGMRVINHQFTILKVNRAFSELTGIDCENAVGKRCYDVFAGSMCHTDDCPLKTILTGRTKDQFEVNKRKTDGSWLDCILTATPFKDPNGAITGIVESFRDITELKNAQRVLESERDKLHRILFHQLEAVGIVNADFELEYQNEVLKKQTGCVSGCFCHHVFRGINIPCEHCLMRQALSTGKIQRFEFDTPAGKSFEHTYTPFLDEDGQKKALVSRRDITERKASTAAAIRSEHLAAIGELAAGVAHEINNPINGIINYGQLLVNRTTDDDFLNDVSRRIIKESDRIATIVKSLLSFARRDTERKDLVNLNNIIQDALTLTHAQLRKDGIQITLDLDEDLMPFAAKAQELQQVFMNLISNSRYALNEKYKQAHESKRVDISARMATSNGRPVIRACFTDWGMGIRSDLIEKIMRPFYSTKPKGKGTGLGLSISHQIMKNHGGTLRFSSVEGAFTKVIVEIPVHCVN
ncbi:PAS domain-containing protein [Desulfosarcina ovata]|uniref:histidine kinase n=1 Tax=Desulfosarcina ovata subsp. ovata TaxID=2752305 RepID=A0A5K8AK65_9BACT|nr:PAS domain-containing protein [Desulfosarcina ovata]BBO92190.1 hypothetical protein DSCOOX_53700 [Desulfosarcina ovata subsp. ovata]